MKSNLLNRLIRVVPGGIFVLLVGVMLLSSFDNPVSVRAGGGLTIPTAIPTATSTPVMPSALMTVSGSYELYSDCTDTSCQTEIPDHNQLHIVMYITNNGAIPLSQVQAQCTFTNFLGVLGYYLGKNAHAPLNASVTKTATGTTLRWGNTSLAPGKALGAQFRISFPLNSPPQDGFIDCMVINGDWSTAVLLAWHNYTITENGNSASLF